MWIERTTYAVGRLEESAVDVPKWMIKAESIARPEQEGSSHLARSGLCCDRFKGRH